MLKKLFLFILLISCIGITSGFIINNSAEIDLKSIPYEHAIKFTWNISQPIIIYPDGQIAINTSVNAYLLDNLKSNSLHFIYLQLNDTFYYSENYPLSTPQDDIISIVNYYKYLIIGWICIFIALALRRSFIIGLIGEIFGIIGFTFAVTSSNELGQWGLILYLFGLAGLTFFTVVILQGGKK